jgi:hypothetical protein
MKRRISFVWFAVLGLSLLPQPALAAFHLMEIEQVIGGVGGDTTAQAVQLKMRTAGQNLLNGSARMRVFDAAGANPITIKTFASNPANAVACREILLVSAGMAAKTSPPATGDYTLDLAIPPGYLAAGSLTFETLGGGVYWRVSWGGATYTGAQTVLTGTGGVANDSDGLTSPAFAGPLPSTSAKALHFGGGCDPANLAVGLSTNSAADYAVTASSATLTNNASASFAVVAPPPIPGLPGVSRFLLPALLGLGVIAFAIARRRRSA